MQLHQLQPRHKPKKKKLRVGRGGKRGTYSGRGQKGQKSRAGHKIKPAVYELISRLPKLRGYKNRPIWQKPIVVNVGDLDKLKGDTVNSKTLGKKGPVKLLGEGEVKRAFRVEGLAVSKTAKTKIEKAGGKIVNRV